jgi:hypothetical protein
MTAPGNDMLQLLLSLSLVIASGYAAGRIHQWYKHSLERDAAFREGYNHASHSMFDMAMKHRQRALGQASDEPARPELPVVVPPPTMPARSLAFWRSEVMRRLHPHPRGKRRRGRA